MNRRRGSASGLVLPSLLAAASVLVAVGLAAFACASVPKATPAYDWQLVARAPNGDVLLRVPLPEDRFVLRYRNSVYGSLAEERFAIRPDGRMALVELAADEAAVLDEYYVIADRPRPSDTGDTLRWEAKPGALLQLAELPIAATRHGERTLVVEGRAVALWQLAGAGGPTVILQAEETR